MSLTRSGFQQFVNEQPAPACAGDFASSNPRASVAAPAGGFRVAPDESVRVGFFAWATPATGLVHSEETGASILGFVHRENQTVITDFLDYAREVVQSGFAAVLHSKGDFWAQFQSGAAVGDIVYADAATGEPTTDDDSGANPDTGFTVLTAVPVDAVFTGSIAITTGVLTVSAVASGVVEAGQFLSGTGILKNVQVGPQLTGTTGGVGTYATNNVGRAAVSSTTLTGVQGKLAKISTW